MDREKPIPARPRPCIDNDITPDAFSRWLMRHEILVMWLIAAVVVAGVMPAILLIAKAVTAGR